MCHASLVSSLNTLFLVGGRVKCEDTGVTRNESVILQYHRAEDNWYPVTWMHTARHDLACACIGSHLYIVGGGGAHKQMGVCTVECFDFDNNCWVDDIASLPRPCWGLSCTSI